MPENQTAEHLRDYERRCATCCHDIWQNNLVGDCRTLNKDVYHHAVDACDRYQRLANV